MLARLAVVLGSLFAAIQASPVLETRQSITQLTAAQIAAFKPYSYYAAAAYCQPANTLAWNCGTNCNANPTFKPIASGGDGNRIQFWYVGWDPTLKTIIVGHQGTDFSEIYAVLTDADFFLDDLDTTLFPGVSSSVKTHNGFGNEQALTATTILAAVKSGISTYGATKVTVVGHSLGAALAEIDAVYLRLNLPASITVASTTYATPRVGNPEWASLVDSKIPGFAHINNDRDVVPILPGRFLGFAHPNGETHILDTGPWMSCPGHDNTDELCTVGEVDNIFVSQPGDHVGPYDGVRMTC